MSLRHVVLAAAAALFASSTAAHATTFDLSNALGATPTFSISSGGNTATFTSPAGNGFTVQDTTGLLSFNTALLDNNFFGTDPLTITFSTPIVGTLSIPFALLDAFSTTDSFNIATNTGQMATFAGVPDALVLGEPEGIANLSLAGSVSSVTLTGTSAFAIGNVTAATPEPGSLTLLATGATGVFAVARRRRTA